MKKPLVPQVGGARSQGITRAGLAVWIRMIGSPTGSVGGGTRRRTVVFASTSFWEKAAPPTLTPMSEKALPPCMSLVPQHWSSEEVSLWVPGPFKVMLQTLEGLCLTHPQSQLIFTARSYEHFSSWHWNPRVGGLGWDPLLLGGYLSRWTIPTDFDPTHVCLVSPCSASLPLLPVSMWLL